MVTCSEDLQLGRIPQTLFLENWFRILSIADRIPTASPLDNGRSSPVCSGEPPTATSRQKSSVRNTIFHHDKKIGVAEIATEIGVPYILSTAASSTIEEVAKANGNGRRWYRPYWAQDHETTTSLLHRAKAAGYTVHVVTLDTWALAWRPADLDNAYVPSAKGIGNQVGFSDPVFRRRFKEAPDKEIEDDIRLASQQWPKDVFSGAAYDLGRD